jgi:Cu/Ag efflux pump CusA
MIGGVITASRLSMLMIPVAYFLLLRPRFTLPFKLKEN